MKKGIITKVAGPLVIAEGMRDANMFDVVRVSRHRLIGEIIEMHGDKASIQIIASGIRTNTDTDITRERLRETYG